MHMWFTKNSAARLTFTFKAHDNDIERASDAFTHNRAAKKANKPNKRLKFMQHFLRTIIHLKWLTVKNNG